MRGAVVFAKCLFCFTLGGIVMAVLLRIDEGVGIISVCAGVIVAAIASIGE